MTNAGIGLPQRPEGLSAFVRCRNEEEFIVPSLLSGYEVFDEIVVILNQSTDRTLELVEDLRSDRPKIRLAYYPQEVAPAGPGYLENVRLEPAKSLGAYYNWCLEQTRFRHVCKWDGDMIALPTFRAVRALLDHDVVCFDGYDVLDQYTTDLEPRIFRYDPARARYVDWELYEVLDHRFTDVVCAKEKTYLHMKLAKREWLHRTWVCPNVAATAPVPLTGPPAPAATARWLRWLRRLMRAR